MTQRYADNVVKIMQLYGKCKYSLVFFTIKNKLNWEIVLLRGDIGC
jgi:hypothetical protein